MRVTAPKKIAFFVHETQHYIVLMQEQFGFNLGVSCHTVLAQSWVAL